MRTRGVLIVGLAAIGASLLLGVAGLGPASSAAGRTVHPAE